MKSLTETANQLNEQLKKISIEMKMKLTSLQLQGGLFQGTLTYTDEQRKKLQETKQIIKSLTDFSQELTTLYSGYVKAVNENFSSNYKVLSDNISRIHQKIKSIEFDAKDESENFLFNLQLCLLMKKRSGEIREGFDSGLQKRLGKDFFLLPPEERLRKAEQLPEGSSTTLAHFKASVRKQVENIQQNQEIREQSDVFKRKLCDLMQLPPNQVDERFAAKLNDILSPSFFSNSPIQRLEELNHLRHSRDFLGALVLNRQHTDIFLRNAVNNEPVLINRLLENRLGQHFLNERRERPAQPRPSQLKEPSASVIGLFGNFTQRLEEKGMDDDAENYLCCITQEIPRPPNAVKLPKGGKEGGFYYFNKDALKDWTDDKGFVNPMNRQPFKPSDLQDANEDIYELLERLNSAQPK